MLVCVTNRKLCREPFLKRIEKLAKSGIDWIILREKDLALEQYRELAKKVNEICSRYGTFLTVYSQEIDFPVHSIQMSYSDFMAVYSQKWNTGKGAKANLSIHNTQTGVSIHSTQEAIAAEKLGAAYMVAGHIFATGCKANLPPRGTSFLTEVCASVSIPVYAIGGMDRQNHVRQAMDCGAKGICVMSSLMQCSDVSQTVSNLKNWMNKK